MKNKANKKFSTVATVIAASLLLMAILIPATALAGEPAGSGTVDVATAEELMQAVNDSNASVINLTAASYQLKPQASSSKTYADEGYLLPDRNIKFTSKNGATIRNAAGKRHIYIMDSMSDAVLSFENVTLKGNDGGGILYYHHAKGSKLTLKGAVITGCTSNDVNRNSVMGGAVDVKGDVELNDCELTKNSSNEISSPFVSGGKVGGDAGAVYADGIITATDCTVSDNKSTAGDGVAKAGGAFYSMKGITIGGGEYACNVAPEGGAFAVAGYKLTSHIVIKDAVLRGNKALYNGGAVMNTVKLTAENVQFIENEAAYRGGALNLRGSSESTITGCTFKGNKTGSQGFGGAVELDGSGDAATAHIKDSTFTGNSANEGGAVSVGNQCSVSIEDSSLSGNTAALNGGAVNLNYYASADIKGSGLSGNEAAGYGGAVNANYHSTLDIDKTDIKNNSSTGDDYTNGYGGGLFTAGVATVRNSTLEGNRSEDGTGGGWCAYYGTPKADNLTVRNNEAYDGGGIYCGYAKLDLDNSRLEGNSATVGGAMYIIDDENYSLGVTLNNTRVTDNTAEKTAGLYTYSRSLIKTNNAVFSNNVSDEGNKWDIGMALATDPADRESLLHNANIIGTTYTAPYTNAYNNIDINCPACDVINVPDVNENVDTPTPPAVEPEPPAVEPETPVVPETPVNPNPQTPDVKPDVTPGVKPGPADKAPEVLADESATDSLAPKNAHTPRGTVSGGTVTPRYYANTVAATPDVAPAAPAAPVSDGVAPSARASAEPENAFVDEPATPFSNGQGIEWSLINLIITIAVALMMVWSVLTFTFARRKDDSLGEESKARNRKYNRTKLFSIIPAVIAAAMFIVMEDISKPMGYIDNWTSLFIVVFFIQAALMLHTYIKPGVIHEDYNI